MSVGSNIKKRRFELNLSQQELASLMGYKSRSTIAKIESGENDVTQSKIRKFAEVLDTSYEALIGVNTLLHQSTSSNLQLATPSDRSEYPQKHIVVILAGGKSIRNHQNIPNQFINILGKPVVMYCLEAYQNHPAIDDIYVVCLKGWEDIMLVYAEQYRITKLRGLIPGGNTGILSVENAVNQLKDSYQDDDIIIFQESTRPLVNIDMISRLLQSSGATGSATICQPMRDYVQFSVSDGIASYIDRNSLIDLQSPEAHKFSVIKSVFERAKKQQHSLTESCCTMLMYNLGYDINFIEGSLNNIKIVRQEDIAVVTALMKRQF